ncbi:DUF1259 domain-containing protein [Planomicrobium sp. CPCC 101079]|uniref:DUF1259 domain-containing protein n=1 Tax=Planomicrobium sp. CPCC 101079 TaxID=2599618 RepID=UPI0011B67030|nr:DUF1259 domain-containing protein [Planomicrobium sp. CPCC 101079]TWT16024.1 DUF1259 domain-containing protein [Planomicrobium sp. CPCC 101079]
MKDLEQVAEKVGMLLGAEIEISAGKCTVNKKRTLGIEAEAVFFNCTLELDISFERYQENGLALNKAEIFLLPEECQTFKVALLQYELPLPSIYRQWQIANPNIVSMYLESVEPPVDFAGRLSNAFLAINQAG